MPELAEVEFFRRRWDVGVGQKVVDVALHADKRIFRGNDLATLQRVVPGAKLVGSEARGKQMLFRFSHDAWLGVHLGMTGELRHESRRNSLRANTIISCLRQSRQSLVFSDPRLFGRVLFHHGPHAPEWWSRLPPALTSEEFTLDRMTAVPQTPDALAAQGRAASAGVLHWHRQLDGRRDSVAREASSASCGGESRRPLRRARVWTAIRFVCAGALRIVSKDYSDPPPSWLFRHRWEKGGRCPKDGTELGRETIGGRTTAWCPHVSAGVGRPRARA
jgi:formamidopyrimidine-DNA glycosylase